MLPDKPKRKNEEYKLCKRIIKFYEELIAYGITSYEELLIIHIPNEGGGSKDPRVNLLFMLRAKRCKEMGTMAGVPDYIVIWKNKIGFVEVKPDFDGKTSVKQENILDILSKLGHHVGVAKGFNAFWDMLEEWGAVKLSPQIG